MSGRAETTEEARFFQDSMERNHCFGCGRENAHGLNIRSRWEEGKADTAICDFEPLTHHSAYPISVVNGGIIATVVDCHSICTAIADAYRRAGRLIGDGEVIMYATASLRIDYRKPTDISGPFRVIARVADANQRRTRIETAVYDKAGSLTAEGEVTAVLVPSTWAA